MTDTTQRYDVMFTRPDGKVGLLNDFRYFSAAINFARLRYPRQARWRGFTGWYIERMTFEDRQLVSSVIVAQSRTCAIRSLRAVATG